MNLTIALGAFMQLMQDLPQIQSIFNGGINNASTADKLRRMIPLSAPILEQLGSIVFPQLAPELHVVAGALTAHWSAAQYLQEAMNLLVKPVPPLAVDGKIGPKTLAAVHKFQADHGFAVTGFLSDAENALIGKLLA